MSSRDNSRGSTSRTTSQQEFSPSRAATVTVVTGRGGQQQLKRVARKGLRDLPPLDLRTPSGRELPF